MLTLRFAALGLMLAALTGCASVSSLPPSADAVDFEAGREGKTGWSQYQEVATFSGISLRTGFDAAKAGLADAGFALRRADFDKRTVIGAHGMTAHDWNIVAGVHLRALEDGAVQAKVHVEGSKDIGFSGDATSGAWTGEILKGMRKYILDLEARRPGAGVSTLGTQGAP